MPLMTWSNAYSVDIPSIDEQHQKLMAMINELHDGMVAKKSHEALGAVLDKLIRYVAEHFAYEESLFDQVGYPEAAAHRQEHETLKKSVLEIQKQYKENTNKTLTLDVMNFLRKWLLVHIQGTDKRYTGLFKAKGIA